MSILETSILLMYIAFIGAVFVKVLIIKWRNK